MAKIFKDNNIKIPINSEEIDILNLQEIRNFMKAPEEPATEEVKKPKKLKSTPKVESETEEQELFTGKSVEKI